MVSENAINITLPVIDDVQILRVPLLDYVEFYTDISYCGPYKIAGYSDSARANLRKEDSFLTLENNPSLKSMTNYTI